MRKICRFFGNIFWVPNVLTPLAPLSVHTSRGAAGGSPDALQGHQRPGEHPASHPPPSHPLSSTPHASFNLFAEQDEELSKRAEKTWDALAEEVLCAPDVYERFAFYMLNVYEPDQRRGEEHLDGSTTRN